MSVDTAFMRLVFRRMKPRIKEVLMKAAMSWGENINDLYMTISYGDSGDLTDTKNYVMGVRSIKTGMSQRLQNDPTKKMDSDEEDLSEEIFPLLSEFVTEQATLWGIKSTETFLMFVPLTNLNSKDFEMEAQIRTKKGIEPKRKEIVS